MAKRLTNLLLLHRSCEETAQVWMACADIMIE